MKVLEAGDWSLLLPPEWFAERDEDSIVIADCDEVGCLEISALRKDEGDFADTDLAVVAEAGLAWQRVTCGSFRGHCASFTEDGDAIREWHLYSGDLLLFITYSCDADNRGLDDAVVDDILDSLRYVREGG